MEVDLNEPLSECCPECLDKACKLAGEIIEEFKRLKCPPEIALLSAMILSSAIGIDELNLEDDAIKSRFKENIEIYRYFVENMAFMHNGTITKN